MDPELNDTPDQLRSDLSAEEQAAADQGARSAFALAFGEEAPSTPAAVHTPAETTGNVADAPADRPETVDDDPFKDLHPKVRDMLAEVTTLKRDHEALKGRLAPTQQKLSRLERENEELRARTAAPAAPAPAAPASEKLEKVRGELPEVAEAIEEAFQRLSAPKPAVEPAASPAPARADETDPTDTAAASLAKVHPDWMQTMNSTDFKLFVAAKGNEYQTEISSTNDPVVVADSLSQFKAHKQRATDAAQRATEEASRRNNRTALAVTPGARQAPAGAGQMTEHDAFLAGFNSP